MMQQIMEDLIRFVEAQQAQQRVAKAKLAHHQARSGAGKVRRK